MKTMRKEHKKTMSGRWMRSIACFLLLFLMTIGLFPAYGSNTGALSKEEPKENVGNEEPLYEPVSHVEDTHFYQKTLKGIYSFEDLYFYVEDYWDTKYVYARIQYDVSQLLEGVDSSLTFSINDIPIQSEKLEYQAGSPQILFIKIPLEEVRTGYNSFSVTAYAKLYDERGCVDEDSDASWLSISDVSYIRCGYESKDANHQIHFYPYPFVSTFQPTGKGLTIAVSDEASSGEVSAAMNLMADLSTHTKEKNEIKLCRFSDWRATNPDRTILISDYNRLPAEYKNKMSKAPGPSGEAIVSFIDDSNKNPLLILTSMDDTSLTEAADMLMDENRRKQETGNEATVEKGSSQPAANSQKQTDMTAWMYTMKDITGGGLTYVGPFHKEQTVYLPVHSDFTLGEGGKVTLTFRYSENLDFQRSLITVYWGDVPCASKKLSKEKASGDELSFEMPDDVIGTNATSLKIAFDLEIQDLICTPRQGEMPWAYVSEESTIYLPPANDFTLSFDSKGSPFSRNGRFNEVLLLLSDTPTTSELNLLGQTIAMYGSGIKPYGSIYVKRAGEFNAEDGDYNIIAAGTQKGNAFISQINDHLAFPFAEDGNSFKSNEQLVLSKEYAGKIGVMELLKSPYSLNRGILVLTGNSDETLHDMEDFLRDSKKREELKKDCVIIDPDGNVTVFRFIQGNEVQKEPTLEEKLVRNRRSLIFTAVATSAMFFMLLAVIILLLRMRMYRKKNEE